MRKARKRPIKLVTKEPEIGTYVAIAGVATAAGIAAYYLTRKPKPEPELCTTVGELKCEGYDQYKCQLVDDIKQWVLVKKNSDACGYIPPVIPGEWTEIARAIITIPFTEYPSGEWTQIATHEITIPFTSYPPGEWTEIDDTTITIPLTTYPPGEWTEIAETTITIPFTGKEPPGVQTLAAEEISHDSAILVGKLIKTGYCNVAYFYFEWGKTISYGKETEEVRVDGGDVGQEYTTELLNILSPNTTYHFRAVAVSDCTGVDLYGYGSDKSFKTETEVVKGFTMRAVNAPSTATEWYARCCYEGTNTTKPGEPKMPSYRALNYVWEWIDFAPDYTIYLVISVINSVGTRLQLDGFYFRLRDGKNYIWDFGAHAMREE